MKQQWKSIKETPPDGIYLIYHTSYSMCGNAAVAFYMNDEWFLFHSAGPDQSIEPPTHWMELPEPPKP